MKKIDPEDFRARLGKPPDLGKWPTLVKPLYHSQEQYQTALTDHIQQLGKRQSLLYASDTWSLLLIFQAMDAAGKDSMIQHVMSGINPQGCQVVSFKHPGPEDLNHDFLWNSTRKLPERGRIGIFNRSYYEEVLIVRVHRDILKAERLPPDLMDRDAIWRDSLSLHRESGEAPSPQRNPHRQILSASFERRTAQTVRKTHRRSGEELEIQSGRYCGAQVLGAVHEALRRLSRGNQHAFRALVHCAADGKANARLIVSRIILNTLAELKLTYPKTTPARRREMESIRKQLAR